MLVSSTDDDSMFPLLNGSTENVGRSGLNEIARAVDKNMKDFVIVFSCLGAAFVLLGAVQIWSDRNPRSPPSPKPPMSPPPRTTPIVSAVAEDEKEKTTVSPSSDGGKSVAGTERNVLDHEKTVLTQKADGVEILHEFKIRRAGT
jgi:hypothetical protein